VIEMVDLKVNMKIQTEIDDAVLKVITRCCILLMDQVENLLKIFNYLNGAYVIPCANGTDALQIAMMALD
jgi:UDP-2-acetamido-2-deoxy-ribo-hexuluronate aminotransferase